MYARGIAIVSSVVLLGGVAAPATGGTSGSRADTRVTISVTNGEFSGYVYSPRPRKCSKDRKIVLFKQAGRDQNPSTDARVASDTASKSGDRFVWSTGNTGLSGKFYARAGRTPSCKPDTSKTIRSDR